jgi:hypothetical protein
MIWVWISVNTTRILQFAPKYTMVENCNEVRRRMLLPLVYDFHFSLNWHFQMVLSMRFSGASGIRCLRLGLGVSAGGSALGFPGSAAGAAVAGHGHLARRRVILRQRLDTRPRHQTRGGDECACAGVVWNGVRTVLCGVLEIQRRWYIP